LLGVDRPVFSQNPEIAGVRWKILKISALTANRWAARAEELIWSGMDRGVFLLLIARIVPVCAFCILGQGYMSQEGKRGCGKTCRVEMSENAM
jgi:hypothetical protein